MSGSSCHIRSTEELSNSVALSSVSSPRNAVCLRPLFSTRRRLLDVLLTCGHLEQRAALNSTKSAFSHQRRAFLVYLVAIASSGPFSCSFVSFRNPRNAWYSYSSSNGCVESDWTLEHTRNNPSRRAAPFQIAYSTNNCPNVFEALAKVVRPTLQGVRVCFAGQSNGWGRRPV